MGASRNHSLDGHAVGEMVMDAPVLDYLAWYRLSPLCRSSVL
jgi:hypothetical protein